MLFKNKKGAGRAGWGGGGVWILLLASILIVYIYTVIQYILNQISYPLIILINIVILNLKLI